jgi:hypothetical protein
MIQPLDCRRCLARMEIALQSILAGEARPYGLRIVKNCEEKYSLCRIWKVILLLALEAE